MVILFLTSSASQSRCTTGINLVLLCTNFCSLQRHCCRSEVCQQQRIQVWSCELSTSCLALWSCVAATHKLINLPAYHMSTFPSHTLSVLYNHMPRPPDTPPHPPQSCLVHTPPHLPQCSTLLPYYYLTTPPTVH